MKYFRIYPELLIKRGITDPREMIYMSYLMEMDRFIEKKKGGGFFYRSKEQIYQDIRIPHRTQDRIRKRLEAKRLIRTKLFLANGQPTVHYSVLLKAR